MTTAKRGNFALEILDKDVLLAKSRHNPPEEYQPTDSDETNRDYYFRLDADICVIGRDPKIAPEWLAQGKRVVRLFIRNSGDGRRDDISRDHAMIEYIGGKYYLSDLGSANGTMLLGARVERGHPLRPGHVIGMGKNDRMLRFVNLDQLDGVEVLTSKELEILQYMADGKSRKEIALVGKITIHTVGDHIKSIYKKLGVSNPVDAVRVGVREGYIRQG